MEEVGGSNGITLDVDRCGIGGNEPMDMEIELYGGAKTGMAGDLSRGGKILSRQGTITYFFPNLTMKGMVDKLSMKDGDGIDDGMVATRRLDLLL